MFGLFSRPKWQHKDPSIRLTAAKQLNGEELADALPTLLKDDSADIRLIAITHVFDLKQLHSIAENDAAKTVRHTAHRRRLDLLTGVLDHTDEATRIQQATQENDTATLQHIATKATSPALRAAAQGKISDDDTLLQLLTHEQDATLKSALLERLNNFAQLEVALPQIKRQDKSFAATVEQRVAALKLEQGDPDTVRNAQEQLCRQVEILSGNTNFDQTRTQLTSIATQWDDLIAKGGSNELEPRYTRGLAVIERIFHEMQRLESGETTMEPEKPAEPTAEELNAAWCEKASKVISTNIDTEAELDVVRDAAKQLNIELAELEASENSSELQQKIAAKITDKAKAIQGPFAALCDQAESLQAQPDARRLKSLEKRWESQSAQRTVPAHLQSRFEKAMSSAQEKLASAQTKAEKQLAALAKNVATQQQLLDDGQIKDARQKLQKIEADLDAIKGLLGSKAVADTEREVRTFADNVQKMTGWQRWGNDRVREELCETLEELLNEDVPPEQKLATLKETQRSWKKLDEAEKGTGRRGNDTWNRFQEAANKLFDQCKPFLEERQNERTAKLTSIEALAAKLAAYSTPEGETLDVKALLNVIREGRTAMRSINDLAHKDRSGAAKKLRTALDHASGLLTTHNDAISAAKQAIVEKAQALLTAEDVRGAMDEAKRLQQAWKKSGAGERKREQKQWTDFRAACDQIFARGDEERNAFRAAGEAVRTELEALCEQAEVLSALGPIDAADQQSAFRELANTFNEKDTRGKHLMKVVKRFQDAEDLFAKQVKKAKQAKAHEKIDQLIAAANICAEIEAGAEADRAAVEKHPVLSGRLSRANNETSEAIRTEQSEMGSKRCLQLEFLAGIDSPAELKSARMQYQVDRMSSAMMGNKTEAITEALDAIKAWVALGPLNDATAQHARVVAAWDAIKAT